MLMWWLLPAVGLRKCATVAHVEE